ncbi:MAG: hypothetical protein RMJ05_07275 [Thermomicrobium sp.]|nr:hypothetical protein [Thermomicrobium sp.]
MQDVKFRQRLSMRPLFVLVSLAGFLLVYLTGILRDQPLLWVTISSTLALILLLVAGLAIESLFDRGPETNDEPAATYENPSTASRATDQQS